MNKKITVKQLRKIIHESIQNVLLIESKNIISFEQNGHNLSIIDYDMDNEDDSNYVKQNKDKIWDILNHGYEKLGGFKGFQTIHDMIKKCPFYKIGYCDGDIVAVTVYNGYLGGSKCVGATCIKDDRHNDAVHLLKLIFKHNITDFKRWIWIEASGKIEEICKEMGSFNVPSDYADIYLPSANIVKVDEYHYQRKIVGNLETKTIFGFKDKAAYEIIKDEQNESLANFLNSIGVTDINENLSDRDKRLQRYYGMQPAYYRDKCIIDHFVYLKDDELINEFTMESFSVLKKSLNNLSSFLKDKTMSEKDIKLISWTIEEGERVLNTSSALLPLAI